MDGVSSVHDSGFDVGEILAETVELLIDLEGELPGVAEDEGGARLGVLVEAVENRADEDGGLAHPALGLTENVVPVDALGDRLLLHLARVFEPRLLNRPLQFRLQHEVFESGRVDAPVRTINHHN